MAETNNNPTKPNIVFRIIDKPEDCCVVLSDGGFNCAYILYSLVMDPETRHKRIYVMNIRNNPDKKKYIKNQITYCSSLFTGVDIRYFGISDLPEDVVCETSKELLEEFANKAILSYFSVHLARGTDIQIYIGSDISTYVEIEFDPRIKDNINYPLKDKASDYALNELLMHNNGLFRQCTTCVNATEDVQWCGHQDCYDCLYVIHKLSLQNYIQINSCYALWSRELAKKWFDLDLPKDQDELNELRANSQSIGCGCMDCVPMNTNSFAFSDHKRIVYGMRDDLYAAIDPLRDDSVDSTTIPEEDLILNTDDIRASINITTPL